MSLLLQALQKAARNRETSIDDVPAATAEPLQEPSFFDFDTDEAAAADGEPGGAQLALADDEDLFEPQAEPAPDPIAPAPTRPALGAGRSPGFAASASTAHAATILRASEERGVGWIDRIRDRPVHAFAVLAGVFLAFYGVYVYLQMFHPRILRGDFFDKPPLRAKSPPAPPSPISKGPASTQPEPAAAAPLAASARPPANAAESVASPAPAHPEQQAGRPIAGLPQAAPAAPGAARTSPAPSNAEPLKVPAASPERTGVPARRAPREALPRRAVARAEPTGPLEDTVAVRQPDSPAATAAALMQAWEALQRGQFAQAEALYEKVEQAEPQNVDALLGLAAIATQRGGTELATRHYSRALELEPRNPTAQAALIALLGQADPQLSESRLKQLIAREPSANLYFALGNLYARMTQWAPAQQAYFQAYQLQPDNPDYAYNLAVGLEHLSQPKLALTYYRQALELGSTRGHASFDTARVQDRIGQLTARIGNQ